MSDTRFYDNLGVQIQGSKVRVIQRGSAKAHAEEFSEKMVALHGNETEFFVEVPTGTYTDGDFYQPDFVEQAMFFAKRREFSAALDEAIAFLQQTRNNIGISPDHRNGGAIHHLNVRLLLQVHVTEIIEANTDYNRAAFALHEATNKKGK